MTTKKAQLPLLTVENARIIFRNFSGKQTKFNPEGNRNFCLLLDDELAHRLEKDGWNIRWTKKRDEDDIPVPYTQIRVGYAVRPPKIVLVSSETGKQTILDEASIEVLDWAEITNVDLTIVARPWEIRGTKGIKGYVRTMYVTIDEDPLDLKYSNMDESAFSDDGED